MRQTYMIEEYFLYIVLQTKKTMQMTHGNNVPVYEQTNDIYWQLEMQSKRRQDEKNDNKRQQPISRSSSWPKVAFDMKFA